MQREDMSCLVWQVKTTLCGRIYRLLKFVLYNSKHGRRCFVMPWNNSNCKIIPSHEVHISNLIIKMCILQLCYTFFPCLSDVLWDLWEHSIMGPTLSTAWLMLDETTHPHCPISLLHKNSSLLFLWSHTGRGGKQLIGWGMYCRSVLVL